MKKVIGFITTKKSKEVKGTKDVYVCTKKGAKLVASGVKYIGNFTEIPETGYIIDGNTVYFNLGALFVDPVHPIEFNEKGLSADKKAIFSAVAKTGKEEEEEYGKKIPVDDFFNDVSKTLQEKATKEADNKKPSGNSLEALVNIIEQAGGTVVNMDEVFGKEKPLEHSHTPTPAEIAKELEDSLNALFGQGAVVVKHVENPSEDAVKEVLKETSDEINYKNAAEAYTKQDFNDKDLQSVMYGRGDFEKFSNTLTAITGNPFYTKMVKLLAKISPSDKNNKSL